MHAQPPARLAGDVGVDDDPGAVVAYGAPDPSDVRQPFESHQMAAFILGPAPPNESSAMAAAMRIAWRSKRQTSLLDNAARLKGTPDVAHLVSPVATRISKLTARRLVITFVPTTTSPYFCQKARGLTTRCRKGRFRHHRNCGGAPRDSPDLPRRR